MIKSKKIMAISAVFCLTMLVFVQAVAADDDGYIRGEVVSYDSSDDWVTFEVHGVDRDGTYKEKTFTIPSDSPDVDDVQQAMEPGWEIIVEYDFDDDGNIVITSIRAVRQGHPELAGLMQRLNLLM